MTWLTQHCLQHVATGGHSIAVHRILGKTGPNVAIAAPSHGSGSWSRSARSIHVYPHGASQVPGAGKPLSDGGCVASGGSASGPLASGSLASGVSGVPSIAGEACSP